MPSEGFKLIKLKKTGDNRGEMVVGELERQLPFEVKRFFVSYKTKLGEVRGNHANRNSQFFMIALVGECCVKIDNGINQHSVKLDSPEVGLYLEKMVWKEMFSFSSDCILLVLADTIYDELEYIREYDAFLGEVNKK